MSATARIFGNRQSNISVDKPDNTIPPQQHSIQRKLEPEATTIIITISP